MFAMFAKCKMVSRYGNHVANVSDCGCDLSRIAVCAHARATRERLAGVLFAERRASDASAAYAQAISMRYVQEESEMPSAAQRVAYYLLVVTS
jgi:hypothetical protein